MARSIASKNYIFLCIYTNQHSMKSKSSYKHTINANKSSSNRTDRGNSQIQLNGNKIQSSAIRFCHDFRLTTINLDSFLPKSRATEWKEIIADQPPKEKKLRRKDVTLHFLVASPIEQWKSLSRSHFVIFTILKYRFFSSKFENMGIINKSINRTEPQTGWQMTPQLSNSTWIGILQSWHELIFLT